jgi:hypothetical protein
MRRSPPPLPADMLLGNDTIREVLSIVSADEGHEAVGLHATVRGVLARRLGAPPSEEIVSVVADAFWDACEECLGDA